MASCTTPKTAWYNPTASEKLRFFLPSPQELEQFVKIAIPCNRCDKCQAANTTAWAVRCVMEMYTHDISTYITLTYNEENNHTTLQPIDIRNFFKRLRHYVAKNNNNKKLRYIQCGEYGDKYHRPHHHALIFGYDFPDLQYKGKSHKGAEMFSSKILDELWGKGMCTVGHANIASATYIASYIGKKIYGTKDTDGEYVCGGSKNSDYTKVDKETGEILTIHKEYMTMSRMPGLGHQFFETYKNDMFPQGDIQFLSPEGETKTYPVPNYFYNKLAETDPKLFLQAQEIRRKKAIEFQEQHPEESTPERLRAKAFILKKNHNAKGRDMDDIDPSYYVDMSKIDLDQQADKAYQERLKSQQAFEQKNKHRLQSKQP